MKSVNIETKQKIPSKICCVGDSYDRTKRFHLNWLLQFIEFDLKKLADKYCELVASFEVTLDYDSKSINIALTSSNTQAFNILIDEIEHILWSYNKQVLTQSRGGFISRYLRFNYITKFYCTRKKAA